MDYQIALSPDLGLNPADSDIISDCCGSKASFERKPAWIWPRSFSAKGRMKRGVFMLSIILHC